MLNQYRELLSRPDWFSAMPAELQDCLFNAVRLRTVKQGQTVHEKHDKADGLYGICEGRLRVVQHSEGGREMLLTLLEPGNWFGEIAMFDDAPRTHTVYCEQDTVLAMIPRARFQHLLSAKPALYPHFTRLLCSRVRSAFQFIDASASLSLREQLIRRLLMLLGSYGQILPDATPITLNLSQESLAQMLNSSRQTVNQMLQSLQDEGLIEVRYRRITILSPAALAAGN
ncbi:Crp/Fnr family transcriptional regulator [Alteromonas halophila]|uniref:Crp/Fnr family transcriptional regulator n=1 Tax=Alteromonas halophila TaxID=516698 RepID=A0A918JPI6_9ALTE|nr:Crp/Fnr family transcriptional regulator [Alteromonas halophila]GGW95116.1 Crp/Fnr family transcriptional regulator [Alteromonas halophila]